MLQAGHITDYLKRHADQSPAKLALVCEDESLSFEELYERVVAASEFLAPKLKSDEQQIVALLMPNTWECVVSYLAVIHAGHIAMPVDVIYKPLEIGAVLHQIPPALVISDSKNIPRIQHIDAPIINADSLPLKSAQQDREYLRQPADTQIASLLFTSGTTGNPKAVPYTHANHIWNIKVCSEVWDWTQNDSLLISLRLSHMHGLVMGLSGALYHGNTLYLQDGFSVEKTLELLASGKISFFTHASLAYYKLLEAKGRYDLSKVRICVSGAAPLPPAIWHRFKKRFGVEIVETYGTTETGRIAANTLTERKLGSPGRPLPEVGIKIDTTGEVLVKSPGLFPGYYKNSDATRKSLTADGYWRTGDLGELSGGQVVLKGRTQERIRKQGYTISPRDIEWALHNNPRIKEILVMGVQNHSEPSDKIVYFLTGNITKEELNKFSKDNLPSVWRPDEVFILDKLPRNRSGKPELSKLREMLT